MPSTMARYSDLVGQPETVARLSEYSAFYAKTGGAPGHILMIGEDGLGQSRIAQTFANERGVSFKEVEAGGLVSDGDLTALLINLRPGEVLMLARVNALRKAQVTRLLGAITSGKLTFIIGQGRAKRPHVMDLNPFTLIATCAKKSECPVELLPEFSLVLELQSYTVAELAAIAEQIAVSKNLELQPGAAQLLVRYCERKPRFVESTVSRVAKALNKGSISEDDVREVFAVSGRRLQEDAGFSNGDLIHLSGQDFERQICRLLERMGFRPEMTKVSGDGGIDIVAFLDKPITGGRYLFQCKRYAADNLVGASAVRDFYGAVTADRAVKGVFISTSDFTPQARDFAERSGVELMNIAQLTALMREHGIADGSSQDK